MNAPTDKAPQGPQSQSIGDEELVRAILLGLDKDHIAALVVLADESPEHLRDCIIDQARTIVPEVIAARDL